MARGDAFFGVRVNGELCGWTFSSLAISYKFIGAI